MIWHVNQNNSTRKDGRVVEGAALEKRYTLTGIVGSNPTLSARQTGAKAKCHHQAGGAGIQKNVALQCAVI